jgi:hypothetical protein
VQDAGPADGGSATFGCATGCPASAPDLCGGTCTNTATDPTNCGHCGTECPAVLGGTTTCSSNACGFKCIAGDITLNGECHPVYGYFGAGTGKGISLPSGTIYAEKITVPATTVVGLGVTLTQSSSDGLLALYNSAGTLVVSTPSTALGAGNNTALLSTATPIPAGQYLVAFESSGPADVSAYSLTSTTQYLSQCVITYPNVPTSSSGFSGTIQPLTLSFYLIGM